MTRSGVFGLALGVTLAAAAMVGGCGQVLGLDGLHDLVGGAADAEQDSTTTDSGSDARDGTTDAISVFDAAESGPREAAVEASSDGGVDVGTTDGPSGDGGCGPLTCAGCCDLAGVCQTTAQNPSLCGSAGGQCGVCAPGKSCVAGVCTCDSASCNGCCDGTGSCQFAGAQDAGSCGVTALGCAACAPGQECDPTGRCVCDSTSCPGGCCSTLGACLPAGGPKQSHTVCGTGGAACGTCASGESCVSGMCTCGEASTCAGCCDPASGTCLAPANERTSKCGANGLQCSSCLSGEYCDTTTGLCLCDSASCAGCCSADGRCILLAKQRVDQCGGGGSACAACLEGQACSSGSCLCTATSCPNGCCDVTGACVLYVNQTTDTCGSAGASCESCEGGTCSVTSGVCQ